MPSSRSPALKSLQVKNMYSPEDTTSSHYSTLTVLENPTGFYIGTLLVHPLQPFNSEYGTRDTTYFKSAQDAKIALDYLELLAEHGHSIYPFDLPVWEMKMTHQLRTNVKYLFNPDEKRA